MDSHDLAEKPNYLVVTSPFLAEMTNRVNELIGGGYMPQGGMQCYVLLNCMSFSQAMILSRQQGYISNINL